MNQVGRFFFARGHGRWGCHWGGGRRSGRDSWGCLTAGRGRSGRSQPIHSLSERVKIFEACQPHDGHLGEHRRMTTQPHACQRVVDDLQHRQQCDGARLPANRRQIHSQAGALEHQFLTATDTRQQAVAERRHHLLQHPSRVGAASGRRIECRERTAGIPSRQAGDKCSHLFLATSADDRVHVVDTDRTGSRPQQLLQKRLAVAHAAGRTAGDQRQGLGLDHRPFGLHDLGQTTGDRRSVDRLEVEPLAPRQNRDRQLLGLRRAEHKLDVCRWLLKRLQQRIEGLPREHVHFIDDVGLVAAPRRPDGDVLPKLPHFVDAAITGGVDLHHVHILPGRDGLAGVAGVAGLAPHTAAAFECLGVDPRRACLADAPCTREEIGVADPARFDRARETAGDMLLADEFVKPLRPVAAGHHLIAPRCSSGRACVGGWNALNHRLPARKRCGGQRAGRR